MNYIREAITQQHIGEEAIALRRHLHAHPDLSEQEFPTMELVCEHLAAAGIPYKRNVAESGVVLPIGAVMVFATSPTTQTIEVYSYFSLLPVGYANFTPLLTGILTILIILLGAIALFKFDNAASLRKAMFVCSVISLLLSIVPLFLFGTVGMTAASYAVSCAILLSICLQAVANRKE